MVDEVASLSRQPTTVATPLLERVHVYNIFVFLRLALRCLGSNAGGSRRIGEGGGGGGSNAIFDVIFQDG